MLAALNTSQRKLLGGLRGVRRSPHRARVENLSPLRRCSVVSARVYAGDCEANVEKERIGWGGGGEPFSTLAWETEDSSHTPCRSSCGHMQTPPSSSGISSSEWPRGR